MKPKISAILTAWMRPQYLEEQVQRILDQTVAPVEIVLWYNMPIKKMGFIERKQLLHFKNEKYVRKIICDHNFGIIPRFTLASCLEGDYICIFDDDTMPGRQWFENCLAYTDSQNVICGTIGLRFLAKNDIKTQKPRMGWEAMNPSLEYVDVVGHSWFFRRQWAKYFWDEEPIIRSFGEDIHFCAMLQRRGIAAACPPHPEDNRDLWGSLKPDRGIDKVAISSSDRSREYLRVVVHEIERGFEPVLL